MIPTKNRFLSLLAAYLVTAPLVHGKLYEDFAQVPAGIQFDYVIVGGGNAGNVVANRLSEDANINVLVLEAGHADIQATNVVVPFFCLRIPYTYNWNYSTVAQPDLGGRVIDFPRGRVLGGSSSVNGMWYSRGSAEDWNRYASVSGDAGWSWKGIQPYILKSEKWTKPVGIDDTGKYEPSAHGTNGVASIGIPGHAFAVDERILKVAQELPADFPFNKDANDGTPLGLGTLQLTVGNGERTSSATAYLAPQYLNRPNLHVVINAQVSRVLKTGGTAAKPAFRGVEFKQSSSSTVQTVTAKREVILSGGVIGSPHILLNSGIGSKPDLTAVGVKTLVNLPGVGAHFSDHVRTILTWTVNSTETWDDINRSPTVAAQAIGQWNSSRSGPLVNSFGSHWSFHRLARGSPAFTAGVKDPVAGPKTPHFELGYSNGLVGAPQATGNYFSITVRTVAPASIGSVKLGSSDPFAAPIIDPAYLKSRFDVETLIDAIQAAFRFVSAPAFKDYIVGPFGPTPKDPSDRAALEAYVRATGGTSAHPTGTASIGKVVDKNLKVIGIDGLRVIDVSVLPFIPSAHTQAAAYIVGERGADIVKAARK